MIRPALLIIVALALATGCKQGIGQRCQIQSDCDDNLVCNDGTQECSLSTGTGLDASVPIDAPRDAKVFLDAPLDATVQ